MKVDERREEGDIYFKNTKNYMFFMYIIIDINNGFFLSLFLFSANTRVFFAVVVVTVYAEDKGISLLCCYNFFLSLFTVFCYLLMQLCSFTKISKYLEPNWPNGTRDCGFLGWEKFLFVLCVMHGDHVEPFNIKFFLFS